MSFSNEQLEQIEEILQSKEALLEGRENRLQARVQELEDKFGRQNIINNTGMKDETHTNDHIRDISSDRTRPSLGSAALTDVNPHLSDLSNHELHKIKKMYENDSTEVKKTLLDEPLGDIIDKTINFTSYSFDSFLKSMYSAELAHKKEFKESNLVDKIYLCISAFTIMLKTDQNMIYMGIIMIFFSNIIYFISILI